MISAAIREWVLSTGSKEDALKFIEKLEAIDASTIKKVCADLREYVASDSCGLPDCAEEMAQGREELLPRQEADRIFKGDLRDEEPNEVHEGE